MMEFQITTTWDGQSIDHSPAKVVLDKAPNGHDLKISVEAPFFNDPPNPRGPAGKSFYGLWEYEVIEEFFLNDKDEYLEVQLCPHGQQLALIFRGSHKMVRHSLPISYKASIEDGHWKGEAVIPAKFLPSRVSKFNAFAMHGVRPNRSFEALYPQPQGKYSEIEFHRLEYFQPLNLKTIVPQIYEDMFVARDVWNQ